MDTVEAKVKDEQGEGTSLKGTMSSSSQNWDYQR